MEEVLKPLRQESLKEVFVSRFEEHILSGRISTGHKLPSERNLARQLGVSRPVVHEGLVDLAARGLVTMKPRVGTFVNDYRKQGSISILNSLIRYDSLAPQLLNSILELRLLFETETARLAALNRSQDHVRNLYEIIETEKKSSDTDSRARFDFKFHHQVAMAGGNLVYPLIINSFQVIYTNMSARFHALPGVHDNILSFHTEILHAIEAGDAGKASSSMTELLRYGRPPE